MKLLLSAFSICRTPVFSINDQHCKVWEELKEYIHESSPEFFGLIKDYNCDELSDLEPKIRFTIWKYFNRAKYRATPYGNFAAFTVVPVLKENHIDPIVLNKQTSVHRFPNWQEKERINFDPKLLSSHARFFRTNTTMYPCSDEIRYVSIEDSSFELSAITISKTLRETLQYCRSQRTLPELRSYLKHTHRLNPSLSRYIIEQLTGSQLLLTDFQPNITGTDYFSRIGYNVEAKTNDYLIAERERFSGHLSDKKLDIIPEIINFLNRHLPKAEIEFLNDFKSKFSKRYDQKKIPLMVAMDPEIGIGYRALALNKEDDQLVHDLKVHRLNQSIINHMDYTPLHSFLLNAILKSETIQLEKFEDKGQINPMPVPNTLSAIFNYSGEDLVIKHIGGCTANSLLGRFSMASDEITTAGKRFAQMEQEANPGVLFFDIAYQLEKNADNINRRKRIYDFELPILSWTESTHIIDPDDVLISIENNELVLHSAKYQKRIVPRLASAYNYTRSDLSLYRFLSDLQHQHLRSDLNISLTDMFPGLVHYPRLKYKHVILSPEKWLVPDNICKGMDREKILVKLSQWLEDIGLKVPFRCGFADQTLVFDPSISEEMDFFLLFCKNKKTLYIEESFPSDLHPVVNENQQPYLSEFIVNIEHRQQIYHPYPLHQTENMTHIKSAFLPGEEWVYFEIYCHPTSSDAILLLIANAYIRKLKKRLKNWFFIRYNDPSYHIRLRLKPARNEDIAELISRLSHLLAPYFKAGTISDLQLRTYHRETERYGPERMELVEQCFSKNSNLVLYLLSKPVTVHHHYYQSIRLIEKVMEAAAFSEDQQLSFAGNTAAKFAAEMSVSPEGSKKINIAYKNFLADTSLLLRNQFTEKKISDTAMYFLNLLSRCAEDEKEKMLFDLFHMHTNRLFRSDQRVHEMIMYYFLTKKIKTRLGRQRQNVK